MSVTRLVLFDIDGTLVLTGRAGLRAMNLACRDLTGSDTAMEGVSFAGRTDWSILDDVLRKYGQVAGPRAPRRAAVSLYVPHLAEEIQLPATGVKDVMPGIRPLLDALPRRDDGAAPADRQFRRRRARSSWNTSICGSTFRAAPSGMMPRAGTIWCRWPFGALASAGLPTWTPRACWLSATRPSDVACALVVGATPVAVATGGYTIDQLRDRRRSRLSGSQRHERVPEAIVGRGSELGRTGGPPVFKAGRDRF